jgi:hypothetical protein
MPKQRKQYRDEDRRHSRCGSEPEACDFFDETRINPWSGLELNDQYQTYRTVATRCGKRTVRPAGFSPRGPWRPKVIYPSDADRFSKPRRALAAPKYHGPVRRVRTEVRLGDEEQQQQQYGGGKGRRRKDDGYEFYKKAMNVRVDKMRGIVSRLKRRQLQDEEWKKVIARFNQKIDSFVAHGHRGR